MSGYAIPRAEGDPDRILKILEEEKYKLDAKKPGDPLLLLLYKYSPDAYYIIRISEDCLQNEIKIGGYPYAMASAYGDSGKSITTLSDGTKIEKIRRGKGYKRWIDYDKPFDEQVKSLATAVHEENHGLTSRNALYILSKKVRSQDEIMVSSPDGRTRYTINFDSYYLSRGHIAYALRRSATYALEPVFPAARIEEIIPVENRTFRYKTYIDHKTYQSTQVSGISGLLDEYNAYYWSNRVIYDLYEYYKNEKPQTAATWLQWTSQVFGEYFAWAEFRYWILCYIRYARIKEKNVYHSLMEDMALRKAFTAVDDNFTDLLGSIFIRLGKELPGHLKKYNIEVTLRESTLIGLKGETSHTPLYRIGNASQVMFLDYFLPLQEELNKKEFIDIANTFRTTPRSVLPSFEDLKKMLN